MLSFANHEINRRSMRRMNTNRDQFPLPEDLKVFLTVVRKNGFASAAEELGLSPAYISKRISVLETTLSTRLLHRTTRRIALTDDGERVRVWAEKLLGDLRRFPRRNRRGAAPAHAARCTSAAASVSAVTMSRRPSASCRRPTRNWKCAWTCLIAWSISSAKDSTWRSASAMTCRASTWAASW